MKKIFLFLTLFSFACQKEDAVVSSINFSNEEYTLLIGEGLQLDVLHTPNDLSAPAYQWESSNSSYVVVDNSGYITAKSDGEAVITVATESGLSASCKVVVEPIAAESLTLDPVSATLNVRDSLQLVCNILPESTTYKDVEWTSSDDAIAVVDEQGCVVAIAEGECTIFATTNSGTVTGECDITVKTVPLEGISLELSALELEMTDTLALEVSFLPINATNMTVVWTSENEDVAIVSDSGVVFAIAEGSTIITGVSEEGGYTTSCSVQVYPKGIVLSEQSLQLLPNKQKVLYVNYSTSDDAYIGAVWSSSNPDVADVTSEGDDKNSALVETKSAGSTTITATTKSGEKIATCSVVVDEITSFISLDLITSGNVYINGYITGNVYSKITNGSSDSIEILSLYIYSGSTGQLVGASSDNQTLSAGSSINLGMSMNSVYLPIFKWTFEHDGVEYSVQHQYEL